MHYDEKSQNSDATMSGSSQTSDSKQSSGISSRSSTTLALRPLCGPENGARGKEEGGGGGVGKGSPFRDSSVSPELHVLSLWRKGLFPRDNRRCKRPNSVPAVDSQ